MKTQLLKFTALLLILTGLATSCNPECPGPEMYPKEISFTEYSLEGTSCQWKNLPYNEKVMIINSSEELEKYISCNGGNYPAIDFSKQTLLLVSGYINGNVSELIAKNLKQVSSEKYILSIEIDLKYKDNTAPWNMALIVDKLSGDSNVKLNLTLNAPKIIRPVMITDWDMIQFFEKSLHYGDLESTCFFTNIDRNKDTCILINSIAEFQQSYVCTDNLPEIDFEKYTLIIGKKWVVYYGIALVDQKIIEDNVLTLLVTKFDSGGGAQAERIRYHWGVYPKLPNKPFFVEYKYEEE